MIKKWCTMHLTINVKYLILNDVIQFYQKRDVKNLSYCSQGEL